MTRADMRVAVLAGHAEWIDVDAIVWLRTGLVVRLRLDLPTLPVSPRKDPIS